jgi:hypothetical protein
MKRSIVRTLLCVALAAGLGYGVLLLCTDRIPSDARRRNIRALGIALTLYTEGNSGSFPPAGWDERHNRPKWQLSLLQWLGTSGRSTLFHELGGVTPFPLRDYELNPIIAGRDVISTRNGQCIMLRERRSTHYGGKTWFFYLDGHVAFRYLRSGGKLAPAWVPPHD